MPQYRSGLIGLDVKSRRKVEGSRTNRFRVKKTRNHWLLAIIALASLGLFVIAGLR